MITAIALRYDFTLVTGNLSHYQRIQALGYGIKLTTGGCSAAAYKRALSGIQFTILNYESLTLSEHG
jgi:hypothetical protein